MKLLPDEADFGSRLRGETLTARLGLWVGVCFGLAFVTGILSHDHYLAEAGRQPWFPIPTRPVWGYRLTQGVHVLAGTAAIPLLLVKLWSVYPKLFARPPRRPAAGALHLLERGSIAVLVASSVTQLAIGLANQSTWYPWDFHFRATHYALAWVAIGALLVHVAVKLPVIRRALGAPLEESPPIGAGPSRRDLLRGSLAASALAVLATAGIAVPGLRRVSVLGVRSGSGPQGIPVNKSARAAGVVANAVAPGFRLTMVYGGTELSLDRGQLEAMTQRSHRLPIACVEGWSAAGTWTGVRLRDLLDLVGAPPRSRVRVVSLQPSGPFRTSEVPDDFADDPLTLLALGLDGEPLSIDHGYPCRIIAPNRPGVFQTKWVARLEVLS